MIVSGFVTDVNREKRYLSVEGLKLLNRTPVMPEVNSKVNCSVAVSFVKSKDGKTWYRFLEIRGWEYVKDGRE